jgi:hypothetical protein
MAIPLVFIGIAAVTGAIGGGTTIKAGFDTKKAKDINAEANYMVDEAAERLDILRTQCGESLNDLGQIKISILNNSVHSFLETFEQIKNVDFQESLGLLEVTKLHIDKKDFELLGKMSNFAVSLGQGGIAGVAGGTATALGAYGAASALATASTGTAISALSGAAATNATLAFFGGGSLAAGGLGIAGGTAVLGGLVAGPALLVMGVITGAKAGKNLENAKANKAQAEEIVNQLQQGGDLCIAIRRRSYMFYSLLSRLDARFIPLINRMNEIVANEGYDYSQYSIDSKKAIASAASIAVTIKSIIDTPLLTEEGNLTEASGSLCDELTQRED